MIKELLEVALESVLQNTIKTSPKDKLMQTDWFKQKCEEADKKAIQNLKEMMNK
jgi:hypothetical protein